MKAHELQPPGGRSVARHLVLFGVSLALPALIMLGLLAVTASPPTLIQIVLLLTLAMSLLALLFARNLRHLLEALAARATDLAEGRPVEPLGSGIREVDAVSAALAGAAEALDGRDSALRTAMARLETINASLELEVERRTKEAEEALALLFQSQKMESLGRLTGGVAHDFNNLLTPIVSCLDLLHRQHDDPRSRRLIDGAMASAERAAALVRHLLAFARRQSLEPRPTDPARLVESMRDLLDRSLGPNIAVTFDIPPDLPAALVDPNQLELALLNLSVNARDAMPDGGDLALVARAVNVDEGEVPELAPGRYVRFRIKDSGEGMDMETLARAHEPFFTTKGVGQGTGLGLSMVHGLAAQSGVRSACAASRGPAPPLTCGCQRSKRRRAPHPRSRPNRRRRQAMRACCWSTMTRAYGALPPKSCASLATGSSRRHPARRRWQRPWRAMPSTSW